MVFAIQSLQSSLAIIMAMLSLRSPFVVALANYTPVGPDINGSADSEQFGTVVSMSDDGNAFVVGAPYAYNRKGAVRVFQKDSSVSGMVNYIQVGGDIVGRATKDYFGSSVSMSGDGTSFVVGAPDSNSYKGYVSVYQYKNDTGNFTQVGSDIVGKVEYDQFGYSVTMSGDGTRFVVGANFRNSRKGSVSVYQYKNHTSNYTQVGLDIVGKASDDRFGSSVSMSGDGTTFVVGALLLTSNSYKGSVSVYKHNNVTSNFTQVGLDIVGKARDDYFGSSVSMSGDGTSFVAGAWGRNAYTGYVSVYKYKNDTSNFTQVGLDIVGRATIDSFGYSVSMAGDGTSFVAGAPGSNSYTGSASVYQYKNHTSNFTQVGLDVVGKATGDRFGYSVSMSGDGTIFVVGAPLSNSDTGSASVHKYSASTSAPTAVPTKAPTASPTSVPTAALTKAPTITPTRVPTAAPTKAPTASPSKAPRAATTKAPSKAPVFVISPTETPIASIEKCGLFGWNLFCLRRGKCGFVKRLLNWGNCS